MNLKETLAVYAEAGLDTATISLPPEGKTILDLTVEIGMGACLCDDGVVVYDTRKGRSFENVVYA